jgi:hypothetical protein
MRPPRLDSLNRFSEAIAAATREIMLGANNAPVNLSRPTIFMMEADRGRITSFYNFAASSFIFNPEQVGLISERVGRGGHEVP